MRVSLLRSYEVFIAETINTKIFSKENRRSRGLNFAVTESIAGPYFKCHLVRLLHLALFFKKVIALVVHLLSSKQAFNNNLHEILISSITITTIRATTTTTLSHIAFRQFQLFSIIHTITVTHNTRFITINCLPAVIEHVTLSRTSKFSANFSTISFYST